MKDFFKFISILLTIILIIISSIRITYFKMDLYDFSLYFIINGVFGLIIYILSHLKTKISKIEIFIYILMFLTILSLINCLDINTCLFGNTNRYEGLFVILTYYILLLNSLTLKNKKYTRIIIYFILLYGFLNIVYGMLQTNLINHSLRIKNTFYYARGFVGNSMFFGSLVCICYSLILGFIIKCNNVKKLIILYILLIIYMIGAIISGSLACILSISLIHLLVIIDSIILIKKDKYKGLFSLINIILISIISIFMFLLISIKIPFLKDDILVFFKESKSISEGVSNNNFGTGRIYIWKNTLSKIKENYLFGVGIDNFANAFDNKLIDGISGFVVDKAHNEYLQIMLCEGVIKGILYIVFLLLIFFKSFKKEKNSLSYGLFLAFTSYSIQAFFGISVTRVAPIFFIITGLLIGRIDS